MKSCFLFGHSICPDDIFPKIQQAIADYYSKYAVTDFYIGNRGRFDSMAAAAVQKAKQQHPDIRLYLLLAYHPAERPVELHGGFDGSYYPPLENIPRPYAIVRTNQHMVNTTDYFICYVKHPGNARNLLEFAQRRRKNACITNIAENS